MILRMKDEKLEFFEKDKKFSAVFFWFKLNIYINVKQSFFQASLNRTSYFEFLKDTVDPGITRILESVINH